VGKSSQMEQAERLAQVRTTLHQKIQADGKRVVTDDIVQTLRVLARSHRRFTEDQKTKVFRSLVKEAQFTAAGVELELYVNRHKTFGGSTGRKQRPRLALHVLPLRRFASERLRWFPVTSEKSSLFRFTDYGSHC
jgi:hypothetical protein